MLRSNRYTLELMRQQATLTVSFFDESYKKGLTPFGMKNGRNSNKMAETHLTPHPDARRTSYLP